jgi:hypothetical protein
MAGNYTPYDQSADDQRFIMVRRAGTGDGVTPRAIILVEHWIEELRVRVRR